LKKANWLIWSGELYLYKEKGLKFKIRNYFQKMNITRISKITCLLKSEYELAKRIYGTTAGYLPGFMPSPIDFKLLDIIKNTNRTSESINILVGNSGDPVNDHIEILNLLKKFKNSKIKIFCILSYGNNKNHIANVIDFGKQNFKDKFVAITKFMPPREFANFLNTIDIAIMNHKVPQAFGTLLSLLFLEKKVYLRKEVGLFDFFINEKIIVFDTGIIRDESFTQICHVDENEMKRNKKIIQILFSEKQCISYWRKIFKAK